MTHFNITRNRPQNRLFSFVYGLIPSPESRREKLKKLARKELHHLSPHVQRDIGLFNEVPRNPGRMN